MGRYYSGDIEGKFWFAVQSSNAADRFGVEGTTPNIIAYDFYEDNLPELQEELKKIETKLGGYLPMLDEFFEKNNGYNDKMLIDYGFKPEDIEWVLREYADYELGKKIEKCLIDNGQCHFEGEC